MDAQQLAQACAEAMYSNDRACKGLGMALPTVSPGFAEMSMVVRPERCLSRRIYFRAR